MNLTEQEYKNQINQDCERAEEESTFFNKT